MIKSSVFKNSAGEKYDIPVEQQEEAVQSGLIPVSNEEILDEEMEEKYGDQPVKAGALAFASGATFGLSDQALKKTGLMSQEELKQLRERNKFASIAGEVLGVAGPAVLTAGGSTAALATKAPGLFKAARFLPSGAAAELATRTGSKVAQSVAKKVVGEQTAKQAAKIGAIEFGVTGALEGALFGTGELISEEALGDAEFTAEAIMSRAGVGAIAGGGIGAGLGALSNVFGRALKNRSLEKNEKIIDKIVEDKEVAKVIKEEMRLGKMSQEYVELLMRNSDNVEKDAQVLGKFLGEDVQLTEGMRTGSPLIQGQEATIAGMPTPGGQKVLQQIENVKLQQEKAVEKLAGGADLDDFELGKRMKGQIINRIKEESKPIADVFEATDIMFKDIPVSEFQKKVNYAAIKKQDWYAGASKQVMNTIDEYYERLSRAQTFGQVKRLRQEVGQELGNLSFKKSRANLNQGEGALLDAFGNMQKSFTRIEEGALENAAQQFFKGESDLSKWRLDYRDAKKNWKNIIEKYNPITEDLSLSKQSLGVGDFIRKIDDIDAEKLVKRIGSDESFEGFQALQKDFGDLVEEKQKFKIAKMIKESIGADGEFNPKSFRNKVKKLTPKQRQMTFGQNDEVVTAIERIAERTVTPREFNPSGTGFLGQLVEIFSPAFQLREAARYQLYKKGAEGYRKYLQKGIPNLVAAKQVVEATERRIKSSARGFYQATKQATTYGPKEQMSDSQIKRATDTLELFETNPEKFIDDFMMKNNDTSTYMPKTSEATKARVIASVNFLQSKFPARPDYLMNDEYEAPRSEAFKFNDYLYAIEKPLKTIENLKNGYINPNAIEALKVVYPKMFAKLQQDMTELMPKKLTPIQRQQLSYILGAKVSPLIDPKNMALLQGAPQQKIAQGIPTKKVPVSASKELNSAGRAQGGFDTVANRRV